MKTVSTLFYLFAFLGIFLVSCTDTEEKFPDIKIDELNLPTDPYDYTNVTIPDEVVVNLEDNTPEGNKLTNEGATLGRVLFYDKKMSLNNRVSCGSCHKQSLAFADDTPLSEGFEGAKTKRNSMPIANLRYNTSFFWDAQDLKMEEQVLKPVENHIEMGMEDFDKLAAKLATVEYYGDLFEDAFGTPEVTEDRISKALAQFMRSMVSFDSKYDQGVNNNFSNYSALELKGMEVFESSKAKCANCHVPQHNFTIGWEGTFNIGLDTDYADEGAGRGSFRIPSLRNVARTAPYMHDGRFANLEEVIDHYNEGVKNHPNLDWNLQSENGGLGPIRMNLSTSEKQALVAFLHTLTDDSFLQDPRYATPF